MQPAQIIEYGGVEYAKKKIRQSINVDFMFLYVIGHVFEVCTAFRGGGKRFPI
jgi:hypothetical protein